MNPELVALIALIARHGIEGAFNIIAIIKRHGEITDQMWADLKALNEAWTTEKYLGDTTKPGGN